MFQIALVKITWKAKIAQFIRTINGGIKEPSTLSEMLNAFIFVDRVGSNAEGPEYCY
jgi:hypothetical protein